MKDTYLDGFLGCLVYEEWFTTDCNEHTILTSLGIESFAEYVDNLNLLGLSFAVSPLHDRDIHEKDGETFKKGDKQKPHWHFILKTPKTRYSTLCNKFAPVKFFLKLYDVDSAWDYLTHDSKHSQHKVHYNRADVQTFNNFNLEEVVKSNDLENFKKCILKADEYKVFTYSDLTYMCVKNNDFDTIEIMGGLKYGFQKQLENYCNSKRRYASLHVSDSDNNWDSPPSDCPF